MCYLIQAVDLYVASLDIQVTDAANGTLVLSLSDDDSVTLCKRADVVLVLAPGASYALKDVRVDGGVVFGVLSGIVSRGQVSSFVDFSSSFALALDVHALCLSFGLQLLAVVEFELVATLAGLPCCASNSLPFGGSSLLYDFLHCGRAMYVLLQVSQAPACFARLDKFTVTMHIMPRPEVAGRMNCHWPRLI